MTARYRTGRARRPFRRAKDNPSGQSQPAASVSDAEAEIPDAAAEAATTPFIADAAPEPVASAVLQSAHAAPEPEAAAVVTPSDATATKAERPVTRLARVLAVVPSTGPSRKAWSKLGFSIDDPAEFMGCVSFDLLLVGCGMRFLVPPRHASPNPLITAIGELLEKGTGLLGWTWACQSVHNAREIIEKRSGVAFAASPGGGKTSVVPRRLTPGVTTVLEPLASQELRVHPNHAFALDHIVITVSNVDAVAEMYERSFALKARRTDMNGKRYAFLKVGEVNGSVIEIVGPSKPQIGALTGHGWGLAFRTGDLSATIRYLRKAGVGVTEPHEAVQGGRIASVTMQLGGIAIAFLEN